MYTIKTGYVLVRCLRKNSSRENNIIMGNFDTLVEAQIEMESLAIRFNPDWSDEDIKDKSDDFSFDNDADLDRLLILKASDLESRCIDCDKVVNHSENALGFWHGDEDGVHFALKEKCNECAEQD